MRISSTSPTDCCQGNGSSSVAALLVSLGWRAFAAALLVGIALAALVFAGCARFRRADTRPLEKAGMNYESISQLYELRITDAEVSELVKAKQGGASDQICVELLRLAREQNRPLPAGEAVAGLRQVRISEETILELARLDQLGLWVGEVQAMRLAGISEPLILVLAQHRAQSQPTLSGPSLARLKNAGVSEATLLELARRGVTDDQVDAIFHLRRRGTGDQEIVRRYPPR